MSQAGGRNKRGFSEFRRESGSNADQAGAPLPLSPASGLWVGAVRACVLTIPILNTIGMRDGSGSTFSADYYVLPN